MGPCVEHGVKPMVLCEPCQLKRHQIDAERLRQYVVEDYAESVLGRPLCAHGLRDPGCSKCIRTVRMRGLRMAAFVYACVGSGAYVGGVLGGPWCGALAAIVANPLASIVATWAFSARLAFSFKDGSDQ